MTTISNVNIANRALQKLGDSSIVSLTQDSKAARSCNLAFERVRRSELRRHPWNFAIKRTTLAPDSDAPEFDYDYAFTLPADCLRPLPPKDYDLDWKIEGRKILTNQGDTLELVYIADIDDPTEFDESFVEAFACKLAAEIAEALTGSSEKKKMAWQEYDIAIKEAKRNNAFESVQAELPEDTWVVARL